MRQTNVYFRPSEDCWETIKLQLNLLVITLSYTKVYKKYSFYTTFLKLFTWSRECSSKSKTKTEIVGKRDWITFSMDKLQVEAATTQADVTPLNIQEASELVSGGGGPND